MTRTRSAVLALGVTLAACSSGDRPARSPAQASSTRPPAAAAPPQVAPGSAPDTVFRITEPTPGVLWHEGEVHVIRWSGRRSGQVAIGAVMGGKDRGHLTFGVPATQDSFAWTVPRGFITGFGIARSDAVRIRVEDAADPTVGVESAPFSIAGSR
ncbi:MAG TPA: hypothetical protein VJ847_08625 [Gemmatimonadales bacterium]|nr:hypothetical protein [Gemmatimonadales bacterium]